MHVFLHSAIPAWLELPIAQLRALAFYQGVGSMITIHRDAFLIAPAAVAVCFMLWFLVMFWRDEHRKH